MSRCNVYTSFQKQQARIYFGASHNYPYLFKSYSAQSLLCHHSDLEKYLLKNPEFNVFVKPVIGLQRVLYTQYGNDRGINGSMLEYRLVDYQFTESVTNLLLSLDQEAVSPSIYERVYSTFFSSIPDPDAPILKQERLTLLVLLFENGLLTPDTLETVQHELGRLSKALQFCEAKEPLQAVEVLDEAFSISLFQAIAIEISIYDIFPQLDLGPLRMFA